MNPHQVRLSCNLASLGLVSVAVIAAAWAFLPVDVVPIASRPSRAGSDPSLADEELDDIPHHSDAIFDRPLRRGFRSPSSKRVPTPPKPVRAKTTPAPSNSVASPSLRDTGIRLIGTAIEPGESVAILTHPAGRLDFPSVGDMIESEIEGIQVIAVRDREVQLRLTELAASPLTLKMGETLKLPVANRSNDPPDVSAPMGTAPHDMKDIESKPPEPSPPSPAPFASDDREADGAPPAGLSIEDELDFLNGDSM